MEQIKLFETVVSEQAIENVTEVLRSTWLNEGVWVDKLKDSFIRMGMFNPIMTNSCTSALHLSLVVAGVRPGDEVILPAQTFLATGTAVLTAGAKPIFADIDARTGNICPIDVAKKITEKTRTIIAVHWGGFPCDMAALERVAGDIPIIEDAAHALGAYIKRDGDHVIIGGKTADFSCFSFQAIKFLTTGDGGMVCCRSQEHAEEANRRKWFGIDRHNMNRRFEGDRGYMVHELGFKYHMNNIAAAIGVGNFDCVVRRMWNRWENGFRYMDEFKSVPGIQLLKILDDSRPSFWIFTMLVENRHKFIKKMREAGIDASVLDRRIDEHPVFGGLTPELIGQEEFDEKQVSIPSHDCLTEEQIRYIVETVKGGW